LYVIIEFVSNNLSFLFSISRSHRLLVQAILVVDSCEVEQHDLLQAFTDNITNGASISTALFKKLFLSCLVWYSSVRL